MTETFGDLQESCSDNAEQGETYSVHRSGDEDLLRMEALQQEINALRLKRKHIPSSKSSSSSGSSGVQRVPRPKVQKRASQLPERAVPIQVPDGHLQQVPSHRSPRHAVPVRAVSESRLRSSDDSSCGGGEQRRRRSGYSGRLVKKREKHMASADWSSADEGKLPVRSRGHHGFRRSARRSTSVSTASSSSGDDRRLRRRSTKLKKHVRPLPASSEHLRLKHSSKAAKDDPATVPSEKEATIKGSMVTAKDLKDAWRKEFRIKGQIGKVGDKENKLDFLSVKRQVDKALSRGHNDTEIVEAVINCTVPGSTLRSFLQSSEELSVATLLDILRSYFQEADTVDLLQQLATKQQGVKEDAQTYLMACLDLKNRIMRNEDGGIGFARETVVGILLKTLEVGLSSDILSTVRPLLTAGITDNELIAGMSRAVVLEKKRKEKRASSRVTIVEERSTDADEIAKLQAQLNALQQQQTSESDNTTQLAKLQASIQKLVDNNNNGKRRVYGCKACKSDGNGRNCTHCFICGASDHRVNGCPDKKKKEDSSENSNRSPARDC